MEGRSQSSSPTCHGEEVFRQSERVEEVFEEDLSITPPADPRESLLKTALDAYRDEYEKLAEIWRSIEVKAQGNIAIAGIFIAGAFAFVRDIIRPSPNCQKHIFVVALGLLVASVIFSLLALRTRSMLRPPGGEIVSKLVGDLLPLISEKDFEDRMPAFIENQIKGWKQSVEGVRKANEDKASHLWVAQLSLLAAILLVAVLTIIITFFKV
jgi:hypothetical protein